jgi:hypothetical protein
MITVLALAAAASLLLLPGAWIAFTVPVSQLSLSSRLALAGILSPIVVVAQHYAIRLTGVQFSTTAWLLVAVNAGSVLFIWRRWTRDRPRPLALGASQLFSAGLFAVLVACISSWFTTHELRIFNYHAWLHASIANQFLTGRLVPEEPELAGLALAYPWLGHVFWSVLSHVADWPHTRVYVATDVAALAWTCLAVLETCRALGARAATGRLALLWLTLGTNVVGFWIFTATGWLPGDLRYTPWLRKFMISELSAFVLALLAGLMLTGVLALRTRSRTLLAIACLLTASVGLVYALLLPAALAFSGVLLVWWWFDPQLGDARSRRWSAAAFAGGIVLATVASAAFLGMVTSARSSAPVALSSFEPLISKLATGLVAVFPFVLAAGLGLRRRWREPAVGVSLCAAALCFLIRPAVQLAGYGEYKFMFPTVLLLAPAAALGVERWTGARSSMDWLVLASAVLLLPSVTARTSDGGQLLRERYPPVHEAGTSLVLDDSGAEAGWIAAVRAQTRPDAVVAVRRARFLLPVLTERALVGPPEEIYGAYPGYAERSRFNLVTLRGYPASIVDERTTLLQQVFSVDGPANAADLLERLQALNRPIALVYERGDDRTFLSWLQQEHHGRQIFASPDGGVVTWLIDER